MGWWCVILSLPSNPSWPVLLTWRVAVINPLVCPFKIYCDIRALIVGHHHLTSLWFYLYVSALGYVTSTRNMKRDRARDKLFEWLDEERVFERETYKGNLVSWTVCWYSETFHCRSQLRNMKVVHHSRCFSVHVVLSTCSSGYSNQQFEISSMRWLYIHWQVISTLVVLLFTHHWHC